MKKLLIFTVLFTCLTTFSISSFAKLSEQDRIDDAVMLVALYQHNYAPMPWKKKIWGLDSDAQANALMEAAANAKSDAEFYEAIIRYLNAFHDAHVSWMLPSTRLAYIPINADYFDGEVLIISIDREIIPESVFPAQVGDRIVSIGGQDPQKFLRSLFAYGDTGSQAANFRRAASRIFLRSQTRFPTIPSGNMTFEVERGQNGARQSFSLPWMFEGYDLADFSDRQRKPSATLVAKTSLSAKPPSHLPFRIAKNDPVIFDDLQAGSRIYTFEPFFPLWNSFVQRKSYPMISGVVNFQGHKAGFIRIPDWMPDSAQDVLDFFAEEISYFNDNTEALIIDQTNNPGGNICLAEEVLSYLSAKPISALHSQIKPTRSWLMNYEGDIAIETDPAKKALAEKVFLEPIRRALASGAELSDPIPHCGSLDGLIHPQEDPSKIYQNPILLMIDELSCSTGDMFPALGQDGGVFAATFGHRSVGCGGNVVNYFNLGHADVMVRVTESLGVRQKPLTLANGIKAPYIENIGAQPDIPYTVGARDFRDGFVNYRNEIEKAVLKLIEEKK